MDGFTSIRRSIEHMKITVQKVIKGVRYLKHYGVKEFFIRLQEKMESENVPYEPWYEHHKATEETLRRQRKQSAAWKGAPRVSIVVPLYCTNETFLAGDDRSGAGAELRKLGTLSGRRKPEGRGGAS